MTASITVSFSLASTALHYTLGFCDTNTIFFRNGVFLEGFPLATSLASIYTRAFQDTACTGAFSEDTSVHIPAQQALRIRFSCYVLSISRNGRAPEVAQVMECMTDRFALVYG